MDCQRIQDLLSEYMDGTLEAQRVLLVETHLARCESCRQDLAQIRHTVSLLRALPPLEPPAYFLHAVQAQITEAARPRPLSLPSWIYPSRQGFAVRLAATAVLLIAVLPPVRQGVRNGAWSMIERLSPTSPTTTTPGVVPHPAPPSRKASATQPDVPRLAPAHEEVKTATTGPVINQTVTPVNVNVSPLPIRRPAPAQAAVWFHIDDTTRPGSPLSLQVNVGSGRDVFDAAVEVFLSSGIHFYGQGGIQSGASERIWSGNLASNTPTAQQLVLVADQPGLYDVRVAVSSGRQYLAVSDLLMPVGLQPSPLGLDTAATGPTDLYTALSTLAAQSARPVAVEAGLLGTRPVQMRPRNLESGAAAVSEEFGCGWAVQDGIVYVSLYPNATGQPAVQTVGAHSDSDGAHSPASSPASVTGPGAGSGSGSGSSPASSAAAGSTPADSSAGASPSPGTAPSSSTSATSG